MYFSISESFARERGGPWDLRGGGACMDEGAPARWSGEWDPLTITTSVFTWLSQGKDVTCGKRYQYSDYTRYIDIPRIYPVTDKL